MAQKKRLQVFVSSTYSDLLEERQAAVEAILQAGHIPAGMELFTAGDETQLEVIKRWIDESDVYMLILGGRYGSIEPKTGKSYTQLEYEYAVEKGKPFFSIIITDKHLNEKVQKKGIDVMERDRTDLLKIFKEQVLGKIVRFYDHVKDIKLAIFETMADFSRREDLKGWVPGDQAVNGGALAEQVLRLSQENQNLRDKALMSESANFNGLTFQQLFQLLNDDEIAERQHGKDLYEDLVKISSAFSDPDPTLFHYFWFVQNNFFQGDNGLMFDQRLIPKLKLCNLIEVDTRGNIVLTNIGKSFLLKMMLMQGAEEAKYYIYKQ